MPRRMITSDIWRNEKFGNLDDASRLFFIGCFSNADDDGRLKASPKYLKAIIFPYDDNKNAELVLNMRNKCHEAGLIHLYNTNGSEYLYCIGWEEHQAIRKDRYIASKLPAPDEFPTTSQSPRYNENDAESYIASMLETNKWNPTDDPIIEVERKKRLGNLYADIVAKTDKQYILIEIKSYLLQMKDLGQVLSYRKEMEARNLSPVHTCLIGAGLGNLTYEEAQNNSVDIYTLSGFNGATTNHSNINKAQTQVATVKYSIDKYSIDKYSIDKYKYIYSFWNEQKITIHRNINDKIKGSLKKALKNYTEEEINQAIENYGKILKGEEYYWSHKWSLSEFLDKGIEKFLNFDDAHNNYLRKPNGAHKGSDKKDKYTKGKYGHIVKQ